MRGMLRTAARTFVAAFAVSLAACSDVTTPAVSPDEAAGPRRLASGSSEVLDWSRTLTTSGVNGITYSVSMPSWGPVYLSFNGRIDYPSTAGNSTVLQILVNGVAVTGNLTKGSSYTYPNRGGTEAYFSNRSGGGYLWGLFWSPNFSQNNVSSDYYYVQGGNAYGYELDISGYVWYGQTNTITLSNQGSFLSTSPTIILDTVWLRNY